MFDNISFSPKRKQKQIDLEELWKYDSPKPKKLERENSTKQMEEQYDDIVPLKRKRSVLDDLQFIAPLRKERFMLKSPKKFSIAQWDDEVPSYANKGIKGFKYDKEDDKIQEMEEEELPLPIRLNKKMTMIDRNLEDIGLKLYKNNSTIEIDDKIIEQEGKYGDNVFIQQITALQRGRSRKDSLVNNNNNDSYRYFNSDVNQDQQRLLRDYQITSSINAYVKHHQNYLCLNKLERIFYYVKKINFSKQFLQKDVHELCNQQIKTFHKDQQGQLLRFYQSWVEQDCIYLIYQTASHSLQQKTGKNVKLRQGQVWSLLTDCCKALFWLKDEEDQFHLNIKPGNVLKCRDRYKLADPLIQITHLKKVLKMLQRQQKSEEDFKLSLAYAAPEIIKYRKLLEGLDWHKCDIYSLGICILENIASIPISILIKNLKSIKKNSEWFLKGYSPALSHLLIKMINSDPSKRPNASEILMLPNFDEDKPKKQTKRKLSL